MTLAITLWKTVKKYYKKSSEFKKPFFIISVGSSVFEHHTLKEDIYKYQVAYQIFELFLHKQKHYLKIQFKFPGNFAVVLNRSCNL